MSVSTRANMQHFMLFVMIIVIISFAVFKVVDYRQLCSIDHVHEVCSAYRAGGIKGSLCEQLCSDEIIVSKCLSENYGKTVLQVKYRSESFIVKFLKEDASAEVISGERQPDGEWKVFSSFNDSNAFVNFYGSCGAIYAVEHVARIAGEIYGTADRLDELLGLPELFDYQTSSWVSHLKSHKIVLYFTENLRLVRNAIEYQLYASFYQQYVPSLSERVRFIEQTLLMLERMTLATKSQILMCDVHINNFGITRNNTVKIIDADHLLTVTSMNHMLSQRTCTADTDCQIGDFDDCYSSCDNSLGLCSSNIQLTNLMNCCVVFGSVVLQPLSNEELSSISALREKIRQYASTNALSANDELSRIKVLLATIKKLDLS